VTSKADSLYPTVGAASIVAKVTRDERLRTHPLPAGASRDFGSGYPSDPITKKWLYTHADPIIGFPDIVRFSWSSTTNVLEEKGYMATISPTLLKYRKPLNQKKTLKGIMRYASLTLK
jgi:ribonuclease H2 subunit A